MRSIHIEAQLRTDADRVWRAMQQPAFLFDFISLSHHTIQLVDADGDTRTLRSREHGEALRTWKHTLHVEPLSERTCRYSDTVEIDAGHLTPLISAASAWIYRYRQRRWHNLVRNQLAPEGALYLQRTSANPSVA